MLYSYIVWYSDNTLYFSCVWRHIYVNRHIILHIVFDSHNGDDTPKDCYASYLKSATKKTR